MCPFEHVIVSHQQTLGQTDIGLRNDKGDRQCAQHKDSHRTRRRQNDGFRVVFGRVINVFYVNGVHFHTCIEQENTGRQHNVIEV